MVGQHATGVLPAHGAAPAVERGLVCPSLPWGSSAVFDGGAFAYLALRSAGTEQDMARGTVEFGVYAHGVGADLLADRVAGQVRAWDRDHRSGPGPRIEAHLRARRMSSFPTGLSSTSGTSGSQSPGRDRCGAHTEAR